MNIVGQSRSLLPFRGIGLIVKLLGLLHIHEKTSNGLRTLIAMKRGLYRAMD